MRLLVAVGFMIFKGIIDRLIASELEIFVESWELQLWSL